MKSLVLFFPLLLVSCRSSLSINGSANNGVTEVGTLDISSTNDGFSYVMMGEDNLLVASGSAIVSRGIVGHLESTLYDGYGPWEMHLAGDQSFRQLRDGSILIVSRVGAVFGECDYRKSLILVSGSGKEIWSREVRIRGRKLSFCEIDSGDKTFLAIGFLGGVLLLEKGGGDVLWEAGTDDSVDWVAKSIASGEDGGLFVLTAESVICLDDEDGRVVWEFKPGKSVRGFGSLIDDSYLAAVSCCGPFVFIKGVDRTKRGAIFCLDRQSGNVVWSRCIGKIKVLLSGDAGLLTTKGSVITTDDRRVWCFSPDSGKTVWRRRTAECRELVYVWEGPLRVGDQFVIGANHEVMGFKIGDGSRTWELPCPPRLDMNPMHWSGIHRRVLLPISSETKEWFGLIGTDSVRVLRLEE